VIVESDKRASEAGSVFAPLPQLLRNVRYGSSNPLDDQDVKRAIQDGETKLGDTGRVLIRKSGTEPLIRVMAEGENDKLVASVVDSIVASIEQVARRAAA